MGITSDKITDEKDDLLGRKEFAAEIAKALIAYSKKNTDGITISLTGEWGSGKSTLLNYLKSELKKQDKKKSHKIIEFNPWIFYKEGNIKEAFLIHFALALKDFNTSATDISKRVKDFVSAFKFLKNINAIAGNVQEGLEKTLEVISKTDSIPKIKDDIEKALLKRQQKIFILVDDIDRLTQSEILELLQVISLVMNFSNVYYIIAFDKEIVINAINKEYGDKGLDYLEKIIQVDYSIPKIRTEKLETLFFQMLSDIISERQITLEKSTIKSLWNLLAEYFSTMRDYKRFFNSLAFRLPSIAEDINLSDFIAIEAVRLFDNEGYHMFYSFYGTNMRKREMTAQIFNEEQFKQFNQPTADIIKALLPKSPHDYMREDTNLKRIYSKAYFERYFSLLRNEKDISEKEFKDFFDHSKARNKVLVDSIKRGKMKNLLDRLNDDEIEVHFPNYEYDIIDDIMNFFEHKCTEFEKYDDTISDVLINLVSSSKKKEEYIQKFFQSFKEKRLQASIIHIYFFHYIRMFKKNNRSFSRRHYEFDAYYKENYEIIWEGFSLEFANKIHDLLEKKYTKECPNIKFLYLINYAELFPEDYLNYQKDLIRDLDFVIFILSKFIWMRENYSLVEYRFQYKDVLFPGNLFPEFYNLIKSLDQSRYDKKEQAYINHFLKIDISNYPKITVPDQ